MLGGTDTIRGKARFVKAVAGGAFLLKDAKIQAEGTDVAAGSDVALSTLTPSGAQRAVVVSRIRLPLPNGDEITQVEFFEVANGKIEKLQSYYDSLRFARALPQIALKKIEDSRAP